MPQPLSLKIGHSGVRGIVGESLTPRLVTSFAAAFGTYCGAGPILVGTDTRPSGDMLKQAAVAGLLSVGCAPVDVGVVPVPSLMLHVREAGAFGGISIGGSPASLEWNALRFISGEGMALRANQSAELTDLYHQGVYPRVRALEMSTVRTDATSVARHARAVTRAVDADRIRARRFTIAVDAGGAAAAAARALLEELGCDVLICGGPAVGGSAAAEREAGGGTTAAIAQAETGPLDSSLARLCDLVRRSGAAAGFALDDDAIRLAVVDERGEPLGLDATVALVVQRWLERKPGPVVVNVATSRVVDDAAASLGCAVHRTAVGEPNVVEAMLEHGAEAGGEDDGGVVVRPVNACRDGIAAMAVILEAMAVSGSPPSGLRARMPRYAMLRDRLLCPARDIALSLRLVRNLYLGERIDATDGVKVTWPDRWLLVRPSTTEPVIRIAAEAPTATEARALVDSVLDLLSPGV